MEEDSVAIHLEVVGGDAPSAFGVVVGVSDAIAQRRATNRRQENQSNYHIEIRGSTATVELSDRQEKSFGEKESASLQMDMRSSPGKQETTWALGALGVLFLRGFVVLRNQTQLPAAARPPPRCATTSRAPR
jgi:hypothetical protein